MSTLSFATDENNDLYLDENNNIALATDENAVAQDCEHAIKTVLGELVLNINVGVPYFQVAFNGAPNINQFAAAIRAAIISANPGVVQVVSLDISQIEDTLKYTTQIETIYGMVFLNGGSNAI
jgi:hypothetical protein